MFSFCCRFWLWNVYYLFFLSFFFFFFFWIVCVYSKKISNIWKKSKIKICCFCIFLFGRLAVFYYLGKLLIYVKIHVYIWKCECATILMALFMLIICCCWTLHSICALFWNGSIEIAWENKSKYIAFIT